MKKNRAVRITLCILYGLSASAQDQKSWYSDGLTSFKKAKSALRKRLSTEDQLALEREVKERLRAKKIPQQVKQELTSDLPFMQRYVLYPASEAIGIPLSAPVEKAQAKVVKAVEARTKAEKKKIRDELMAQRDLARQKARREALQYSGSRLRENWNTFTGWLPGYRGQKAQTFEEFAQNPQFRNYAEMELRGIRGKGSGWAWLPFPTYLSSSVSEEAINKRQQEIAQELWQRKMQDKLGYRIGSTIRRGFDATKRWAPTMTFPEYSTPDEDIQFLLRSQSN